LLYFLLHDAGTFHNRIAPALALCWRQRNFRPLVTLAAELQPDVARFTERYHLTADERPLLMQLTAERPFDRRLWRHLAGEVLLYAAADAPTIQTAADELASLVSFDQQEIIRQAHAGNDELEFDGVRYRPGRAGINGGADVARLATALAEIDPTDWNSAAAESEVDTAEELAFDSECLAALREMYSQAAARNQVVVCEDI
jgi:hypothetical protein